MAKQISQIFNTIITPKQAESDPVDWDDLDLEKAKQV
jgi:hypothetical protein